MLHGNSPTWQNACVSAAQRWAEAHGYTAEMLIDRFAIHFTHPSGASFDVSLFASRRDDSAVVQDFIGLANASHQLIERNLARYARWDRAADIRRFGHYPV